jgi:hypothetical protein
MTLTKRLAAAAAVAGALAVAGPVAGASAAGAPGTNPFANVCLHGVTDPGPLGPMGPYGPQGPYGPNGPMKNSPNPLGNVATCGGGLTYILRGGSLTSFVNANLASVGH